MPFSLVVTSRDGAQLRLRPEDLDHFIAELSGPNLEARARVDTYMPAGLADLFAEMAADWKGWEGTKTWSSLEGELQISADADRTGHIQLTVELRDGAPPVWTVGVKLLIEAGQLEGLARDARAFETSVRHGA